MLTKKKSKDFLCENVHIFHKLIVCTCMKTINCTSTQYLEVLACNNSTPSNEHQKLSSNSIA